MSLIIALHRRLHDPRSSWTYINIRTYPFDLNINTHGRTRISNTYTRSGELRTPPSLTNKTQKKTKKKIQCSKLELSSADRVPERKLKSR